MLGIAVAAACGGCGTGFSHVGLSPPAQVASSSDRQPYAQIRQFGVAGKVVWVTPPGAQGNRAAGIGVQFADSAEGEAVRHKIETILAGTLTADKPTHTM